MHPEGERAWSVQVTLDDIDALIAGATPGPWGYATCYGVATIESAAGDIAHAVEYVLRTDADFIAASRTLMPRLVAIVRGTKSYFTEPCNDGETAMLIGARIVAAIAELEATDGD